MCFSAAVNYQIPNRLGISRNKKSPYQTDDRLIGGFVLLDGYLTAAHFSS